MHCTHHPFIVLGRAGDSRAQASATRCRTIPYNTSYARGQAQQSWTVGACQMWWGGHTDVIESLCKSIL